jgi:uncharacterized membrane protein YdjX (TVP38/TMEM64 family)
LYAIGASADQHPLTAVGLRGAEGLQGGEASTALLQCKHLIGLCAQPLLLSVRGLVQVSVDPSPQIRKPVPFHGASLTEGFQALLPALQSPAGAIAFVPLYALWVTLLLPGVWASMLAGALYGTWWGSLIVFVGACLGAEAAFLLGRTWLRAWAQRRLADLPKLQAVERAVSREGLKLVLLTRLSPAFPFSLLNLAYGLSEVSLRDYTIGLIGILPGTILFCGLGALAGDVARFGDVLSGQADPATWALRIVGILATVGVVWLVGRAARKALQESEPPA